MSGYQKIQINKHLKLQLIFAYKHVLRAIEVIRTKIKQNKEIVPTISKELRL